MSKLVEELRSAIDRSDQVESNLAYITVAHGRALLAHIERLQADKAAVIQQAEIQAQEARTQKSIVLEIGKLVGCEKDYEMVGAVKAHIERLESQLASAKELYLSERTEGLTDLEQQEAWDDAEEYFERTIHATHKPHSGRESANSGESNSDVAQTGGTEA